jgi:hypothetical protein
MERPPTTNIPFDKNKNRRVGDASAMTKMIKVRAEILDYQSKNGFTNYTLGSSSKAGFIWSIHQQGLLNDYTVINTRGLNATKNADIAVTTSIQSFSVLSTSMTVVWVGSKAATIKFFVSLASDGSNPSEINSFSNQNAGTFIWNVNSPESLALYYFATIADGSTTLPSNIVQYFNIVTPAAVGYDIIVIAGQSNGQGYNGSSPESVNNANVYQLPADPTTTPVTITGSVVDQSSSTLYTSSGNAVTAGAVATLQTYSYLSKPSGKCFAINFANQYQVNGYLRTDRRVLLVQTCIAGVSFTAFASPGTDNNGNGWWNGSSSPLGLGTQNLIYKVTQALTKTYSGSSATNNRLVALCWQDGEAEASINAANINSYKANLRNFYNSCISGITSGLTTSPLTFTSAQAASMLETQTLLVSGMTPFAMGGGTGYLGGQTVTLQAKDVNGTTYGAAIPRSKYVSSELSDGITTPDVHFDGYDLDILSTNYMTAYSQLGTSSTAGKINITKFFINGSNFTVRWNCTLSTSCVIRLFNNGTTNSNTGGTQVGSNINVNAGVLSYTSSGLTLISNNFYYVTITSSLSNVISGLSPAFPVPTLQIAYSAENAIQDISPTGRAFKAIGTPITSTRPGFISNRTVFSQANDTNYFSISGSFAPGSYTKTGWVKYSLLTATYPHILSGSQDGNGTNNLHLFWVLYSHAYAIRAGNTSTASYYNAALSPDITTGKWYFVATVYDSTIGLYGRQTVYFYDENSSTAPLPVPPSAAVFTYTTIDGTNPGITPADSTDAKYSLFIGGYKSTESTFKGQLDDVRIYNTVLTPVQIEAIRTSV